MTSQHEIKTCGPEYRYVIQSLRHRTQEECAEVIRTVGDMTYFPGTLLTNIYEAAEFFEMDAKSFRHRCNDISNAFIRFGKEIEIRTEIPVYNRKDLVRIVQGSAPDAKWFVGEKDYWIEIVSDGKMIRLRNNVKRTRTLTPKGVILLAYYIAGGRSVDRAKVANRLVQACRESGIFDVPVPPAEEPAPEPASPQIDYAETLRKLFDSVLTLVEKQAEERGAEKLINQLKEAGKL